jgi:hypothetical protein
MKFPELKELPTQELVDRLTAERDALAAQVAEYRKWLGSARDAEVAAKAVEDAIQYAGWLKDSNTHCNSKKGGE